LNTWLEELRQYGPPGINIIIVGNKSDLIEERRVKFIEANEFCDKLKIPYVEVSAKTGVNVSYMFENITSTMVQKENELDAKRKKKKKIDKSHVSANKSITLDKKNYNDKNHSHISKKCCS
jgi:GTPase SAR1 family protein